MPKITIGKNEWDFKDDEFSKIQEMKTAAENSARLSHMSRVRDQLAKEHDIEIDDSIELADVRAQIKTKYSGTANKIKEYENKIKDLEGKIKIGNPDTDVNKELSEQLQSIKGEIETLKTTHADELSKIKVLNEEESLYSQIESEAIRIGLHESAIPDFKDSVKRRFFHEKNSKGNVVWIDKENDAAINTKEGKPGSIKTIAVLMKERKSTDFMVGHRGLNSDGTTDFGSGESNVVLPDKTPLAIRSQAGLRELIKK